MNEVGMLRLAAQRVVGRPEDTPTDAVRWITAVQAQDLPGAITSIALRTRARSRSAVLEAFAAGEIVRSWPMRGTLHLVASEDLAWMLPILTPRVISAAAKRQAGLGIATRDLEQAADLAREALSGRDLSRAELFEVWETHGQRTTDQRGYHLLWYLAQTGVLCFGPTGDRVVLLDEWVPHPRRLEREEALGELALRYFRSHGPAPVRDLTAWAKLTITDTKAAVAQVRTSLETIMVDGDPHLLDPTSPQRLAGSRAQARGVVLLPGFDEFILGYRDRSQVLPPEFADRITPGGNGIFRPTVVSGGEVIGTWRREGKVKTLTAEGFRPLTPRQQSAIDKAAASLP